MRWEDDKIPSNCEYCKLWMNYGSDEDNTRMEKLRNPGSDWDGKECHRLVKLLYLKKISIEEFKEMFTKAGMDYNFLEHCGGCAGCYDEKETELGDGYYSYSHRCPDFNHEGGSCKISDLFVYCCVCGISNHEAKELWGFTTSDGDDFEFCERHFDHPKMREVDEDYENEITTDRLYHEVIKVLRKEDTDMQKRKTWSWKKGNK